MVADVMEVFLRNQNVQYAGRLVLLDFERILPGFRQDESTGRRHPRRRGPVSQLRPR